MPSRFDEKVCPYDGAKLKLSPYKSEKDDSRGFTLTCVECSTNSTCAVHNSDNNSDENLKQKLADSWK